MAPVTTPQPVIDRLHQALVTILQDPGVTQALARKGLSPNPGTPPELAACMKRACDAWTEVMRKAGITPE